MYLPLGFSHTHTGIKYLNTEKKPIIIANEWDLLHFRMLFVSDALSFDRIGVRRLYVCGNLSEWVRQYKCRIGMLIPRTRNKERDSCKKEEQ